LYIQQSVGCDLDWDKATTRSFFNIMKLAIANRCMQKLV